MTFLYDEQTNSLLICFYYFLFFQLSIQTSIFSVQISVHIFIISNQTTKEVATLTKFIQKTDRKREILGYICRFCHHRTVIRQVVRGGDRSKRYDLSTYHQNTIQILTSRKKRGSENH